MIHSLVKYSASDLRLLFYASTLLNVGTDCAE